MNLDSKLGVLRRLQTVTLPDVEVKKLTHRQLLRSMEALMDNQVAVDGVVASLLRPLVDQDLSVAFYDMTTLRAEGLATVEGDVRKFGMAKEGLIARQFMLGAALVMDSRKNARAASAGAILVSRLMVRGVAGVVTDGGFRALVATQTPPPMATSNSPTLTAP